jgi:hypothetical protein
MRRLLTLIWLALALALASGPAFAMSEADCSMASSSSPSSMHHDSNDCCKPACTANCATACPAVVVPSIDRAGAPAEPIVKQLFATIAAPLHSTAIKGADPPPRTIFS